jgi:hypothetical protein
VHNEDIGLDSQKRAQSEEEVETQAAEMDGGDRRRWLAAGEILARKRSEVGGECRKDSHVGIALTPISDLRADDPRARRKGGFYKCRSMANPYQVPPLSLRRSRLAILVYQGSDPTQPYPTLVIRDRAPRFPTALRLGDRYDVVRPLVWTVTLWDRPPLIVSILPGSPPAWPRPRGGSCPEHVVRHPAGSGPGQVRPSAPRPPRGTPHEAA